MITGDVVHSGGTLTFDFPKIKAKRHTKQHSMICNLGLLPVYIMDYTGGSVVYYCNLPADKMTIQCRKSGSVTEG